MLFLFVDDDPDEYEIFCEALKTFAFDVECIHAANGIEALRCLKAFDSLPDYIFLDSNMPLMDGKECLGIIRAQRRYSEVPVLVYTTSSDAKEKEVYQRLGANDFIQKPGSFDALIRILGKVVATGRP